jgi:hypothetical protein
MLSEDFYIDAAVIAAGLCLAAWGAITLDITLFAIGCLFAGAGAYEMRQRMAGV